MFRGKGPLLLTLTAALAAAAAAGCKATDQAEEQGRARTAAQSNAPRAKTNANAQAQLTPPAKPAAPSSDDGHGHDTPVPAPEVRRVDIEEARAAVERGEAVFVDVRGEDAFREGRIPGAILILANDMTRRAAELPAGKQIITYCA